MATSTTWQDLKLAGGNVRSMARRSWTNTRWGARSLGRTYLGRPFKEGVMETLGWQFDTKATGAQRNLGFGGLNQAGRAAFRKQMAEHGAKLTKAGIQQGTAKYMFRQGLHGAGKVFGRALGPALSAYFVYEGYQKGGVWGAAKELGFMAGSWGALKVAGTLASSIALPLGVAAGVAGAAYGGYKLGEAGIAKRKSLRRLELQVSNVEAYQNRNAYTMRQRALQALQNTHLNGRMALGQEALLMH